MRTLLIIPAYNEADGIYRPIIRNMIILLLMMVRRIIRRSFVNKRDIIF